MFHYKYVKHKSNYLRVTVPMGTDCVCGRQNGTADLELRQGACTLVFPLFGGEQRAVARYEAGNINGERLLGETIVPYVYEQGKIRVSDYDYQHHGLWAKQPNDRPPYFRLLRCREKDGLFLEEPVVTISSSQHVQTVCSVSDRQDALTAAAAVIQSQLRTIYDSILEAVEGTGVLLSIHKEDLIERDEAGNIVGAAFVGTIPGYTGYFYNVDGSASDNRPGGSGWLDYYDRCLNNPPVLPIPRHQYCSSNGYSNLACNTMYYGGHVLLQVNGGTPHAMGTNGYRTSGLAQWAHQIPVTSYVPGKKKFDKTFLYYILPICNQHNNTGNYDVAMRTQLHGTETLLELDHFRSTTLWQL